MQSGKPVDVAVTVHNTGKSSVDLTSTADLKCADAQLAAGSSTTCKASTTAGKPGSYQLSMTITGTGPDKAPLSTSTPVYFQVGPTSADAGQLKASEPTVNGQQAGTSPGPQVVSGQPAKVSTTVTNSGSTTVTNISGPSPSGKVSCAETSLTAGASTTCTVSTTSDNTNRSVKTTITGTDAGKKSVTAESTAYFTGAGANGQNPNGQDPNGQNPVQPVGQQTVSGVQLSQPTVNGMPAGSAPGPDVKAGDKVKLSVTLTNNTPGPLTGVSAAISAGAMQCEKSTLNQGESTVCTLEGIAGSGPVALPIKAGGFAASGDPLIKETTAYFNGVSGNGGSNGNGGSGTNQNVGSGGSGGSGTSGNGSSGTYPVGSGGSSGGGYQIVNGQQVSQVPNGAVSAGGGPAAGGPNIALLILGLFGLAAAGAAATVRRRLSPQQ